MKPLYSIDTSFVSFSPFYKGAEERKEATDKRKDYGAVDELTLE